MRWLRCSAVFADHATDDAQMPDPGGDIDDAAGMVERGFLLQGLWRTVAVVVPRVPAQDLAEVPFAGDQHAVEELPAQGRASRSNMRSPEATDRVPWSGHLCPVLEPTVPQRCAKLSNGFVFRVQTGGLDGIDTGLVSANRLLHHGPRRRPWR